MLELLNESRSSLKVREINSFTLISRSCIIHKRLNEEKLHYPKKMPNSLMIVFNIVAIFFIVNDIWFVSDIWFVVCVWCSSQGRLCVAHDRSESFIGKLGFVLELAHWLWDRWPCFHRSVGGFMIITKILWVHVRVQKKIKLLRSSGRALWSHFLCYCRVIIIGLSNNTGLRQSWKLQW